MAAETKVSMTEGPLLGVLVRVAVPIVLSNLLTAAYQVVNALFVGRLGAPAIAAVAASVIGIVWFMKGPWRRPLVSRQAA